jgi:hypothetical protein
VRRRTVKWLLVGGTSLFVLGSAAVASAQVQVTPNFSVTPSKTVTPWVYQMAVGAAIIGLVVVILIGAAYLRFAPSFFARKEPAPKAPPGSRPSMLARPAVRRPAGSTRPAPAASATATATAPRPASGAVATAEAPTAAEATARPTAGPQSEPAVQADAAGTAEAAAPEARPSTQAPEEIGAPPEAAAPEAVPPEAPAAEAPEPTAHPPAAQPAASRTAALDQETFDRVLQEQLDKGVDRRVAEGRARAAAVVAARKKAQG